jgi:hypothetical protein
VRTERNFLMAGFATALITVALLLHAPNANAQQSAATVNAAKEVPDNPADHTPPAQPVTYNHQTHLALGLECSLCHTNPEPGNLMTFPPTSTCMSCHTTVATKKPSIQKLASLAKSEQPIPWVRVYTLTSGVNWTHRKHLEAGVKCETCHGQVADMAVMSQATSVTSMGVCINCHKLHSAPTVCQTCHLWPSN